MTYTFTAFNKYRHALDKGRKWLLIINGIAALACCLLLDISLFKTLLVVVLSCITLTIAFLGWQEFKETKWGFYGLLLSSIVLWTVCLSLYFVGITLLLLGLLDYFLLGKNQLVHLSENDVLLQPLPFKHQHDWGNFSNIILKDGLLTLDFKNNKLIQLEIDKIEPNESEANINDWLQTQFNKQAKKTN